MNFAERMVYERMHGKDSLPAPKAREPETLDELRSTVGRKLSAIAERKSEIEIRKAALKNERLGEKVSHEESTGDLRPTDLHSSNEVMLNEAVNPNGAKDIGELCKQRCVTPAYAIKRFLANWTPRGRASRSELWWVVLFVRFPWLVLAKMVEDSELSLMVIVADLIMMWPYACLVGRRFHDIGCPASVGVILLLLSYVFSVAKAFNEGLLAYSLVYWLLGFVLLLACTAESTQKENKYGGIPNCR